MKRIMVILIFFFLFLYASSSALAFLDESIGVPQNDLDNHIWFPLYNNADFRDYLVISNPTASSTSVTFWVGAGSNARRYDYTIPA
jgi:hypothetical protein